MNWQMSFSVNGSMKLFFHWLWLLSDSLCAYSNGKSIYRIAAKSTVKWHTLLPAIKSAWFLCFPTENHLIWWERGAHRAHTYTQTHEHAHASSSALTSENVFRIVKHNSFARLLFTIVIITFVLFIYIGFSHSLLLLRRSLFHIIMYTVSYLLHFEFHSNAQNRFGRAAAM